MVNRQENRQKRTVKVNVSPEVMKWLDGHKVWVRDGYHSEQNIPSKALEFYYDYCVNRKGFLTRIMEVNFPLCKSIVRRLGRFFRRDLSLSGE